MAAERQYGPRECGSCRLWRPILEDERGPVGVAAQREGAGLDELSRERADPVGAVPRHALALRGQRHRPVERPGVDEHEAQNARELAGDGALAGTGGSVDGDDGPAALRRGSAHASSLTSICAPSPRSVATNFG